MKRDMVVVSVGWLISATLIAVGGRAIWFGLTPGNGIADVTAAAASGLAFMVGGLAVGLAANGVSAALRG
jgi:Zn-dependent protease with chaperone function